MSLSAVIATTSRSKRGKKLAKAVMKCVSKAIRTEAEGRGLSAKVFCEVDQLPQLELYPNRFRNNLECLSEFENLINNLCQKYSDMLLTCHGKDSYMKLQVKWHDYIRSIAAFVYAQSDTDAQVIPDSDGECDTSTSPVANAWLSLVLSANGHLNLEKETQFLMLHAFARSVYHHEHGKALTIASPATGTQPEGPEPNSSSNNMSSLIRMCGSQLSTILTMKKKELEKANRRASGSQTVKHLEEQIQLIHRMCMSQNDKGVKSLLPTCDEGGMVLPHSKLFNFPREFDSTVRQEVTFLKHMGIMYS